MGNRLVKGEHHIDGATVESYDSNKINALVELSLCLRLGMVGDGKPYIFLLGFSYDGEYIYIHTQNPENETPSEKKDTQQMKKLELIKQHIQHRNDVCLEFDILGPTVPPDQNAEEVKNAQGCYWDLSYAFVISRGMIEQVTDKDEKFKALEQRVKRYTGHEHPIPDIEFKDVAIWKIKLDKEKTFAGYRFMGTPQ